MSQVQRRNLFARILNPKRNGEYVAAFVLTIALGPVSNLVPLWLACLLSLGVVGWLIVATHRRDTKQLSQIRTEFVKEKPPAASGLVLTISTYNARHQGQQDDKAAEALTTNINKLLERSVEELSEADFEIVHISQSNLHNPIEAIRHHVAEGKLREIWLITTETEFVEVAEATKCLRGSELAGQLLAKYLNVVYGDRLVVHTEGLTVKSWDYTGIWKLTETIFRDSAYKEEAILVDITGGTKLMSVAMAAACVGPNRKLQYMDATRNLFGEPIEGNRSLPIGIDLAPMFENDDNE
ncbi:MAG: hypothetical protein ACFCD0_15475 [Gemmataceae bacterium]